MNKLNKRYSSTNLLNEAESAAVSLAAANDSPSITNELQVVQLQPPRKKLKTSENNNNNHNHTHSNSNNNFKFNADNNNHIIINKKDLNMKSKSISDSKHTETVSSSIYSSCNSSVQKELNHLDKNPLLPSSSSPLINNKQIDNNHLVDLPSFLFYISNIKSCNETNSIQLNLTKTNNNNNNNSNNVSNTETQITICYLHDSWISTELQQNGIVHILAEPEPDGSYKIDDKKGLIITNPHHILSGTTILSGLHCLRKSVLNWKFKDIEPVSSHMVLGNLLHLLFQSSITNKIYDKPELNTLLLDLLKRKKIINQLYEANLNQELVVKETLVYLNSIEKWLHEHVKIPLGSNKHYEKKNSQSTSTLTNAKNLQILNICDIEESIWSPKYAIKGNLDLTIQADIKLSAYKNLVSSSSSSTGAGAMAAGGNKKNINQMETHIIPVELKSGRTTFSAEHEGQVMLYSLLNSEKRKTSDFGLLLYLKDMNMKFIKVTHNNIRGLVQLRNDLAHYISTDKLPDLKNDERICTRCPLLVTCSMFSDYGKKLNDTNVKQSIEYELDIYAESIRHLSEIHRTYFFNWYKMLEFEFKEQKQFESGNLTWWSTPDELESNGWTVFNLKLIAKNGSLKQTTEEEIDDAHYSGEGFFLFEFKKVTASSTKLAPGYNLKENDMILLSSQTDNLVGISQGFIRSIKENNTAFTLLLDKNLSFSYSKIGKDQLFRIDKINYRSSITLNYTNLSRLMASNERCQRLRSFIIDKNPPMFDTVLPKHHILKTKHLFRKLNQSQQTTIIKTLMARDYLLIKGYPGTGKTTTIAILIAILVKLEKRILFTSFTNSAVDNLLLKISNDYSVDFLRIGSYEKIHPDIQKFELNSLTSNITSVDQLDEFYKSKQLIATTCSSIGNPLLSKFDFDYCIVDEASQVLLTTCLGPLFSAKKFVLVGDLEQLPPIVKNKEARLLGMGVSLFEWLDSKEGSVELVHQYRMNNEIMNLANDITYCGKLKCVSETIANSFVTMNEDFIKYIEMERIKQIFTSSVIFIDTTKIITSMTTQAANTINDQQTTPSESHVLNMTECEIVFKLCNLLYKHSKCNLSVDVGIIAPYNNQVRAIQKLLSTDHKYAEIEVNTVDQFQGRDKRVIIMSFTNSNMKNEESKEFEILNDKRRLTVALTRAKEKLILIGCVQSLKRYKPVMDLIKNVEEKKQIVNLENLDEIRNLN